jgi:hypothetical protein
VSPCLSKYPCALFFFDLLPSLTRFVPHDCLKECVLRMARQLTGFGEDTTEFESSCCKVLRLWYWTHKKENGANSRLYGLKQIF